MKAEEFLAGMKNVDADLIEEAAPKTSHGIGGKIARGVLKGIAAAALCAVAAGGILLASRKYVAPPSAGTDAESTAAEQSEPEQTEPEQTEPAFKDIYDIPGALTKNSDSYKGWWPKNICSYPTSPDSFVESCKNNHAILVYGEIKNIKTITVNVDALDMYCEPVVNSWAIYTFDVEIEKNVLGECGKKVIRLIASNMIRESTDISTSLSYWSDDLSLQEGKKALFKIKKADELTDQPFIIDIDPSKYADYYACSQYECDGETLMYHVFPLPLSVFDETEQGKSEQVEPAYKDIYDIPGVLSKGNNYCNSAGAPMDRLATPDIFEEQMRSQYIHRKENDKEVFYGTVKNLKCVTVNVVSSVYDLTYKNVWAIYTFDLELEDTVLDSDYNGTVKMVATEIITNQNEARNEALNYSIITSARLTSLEEGKKALFVVYTKDTHGFDRSDVSILDDGINLFDYGDFIVDGEYECDGETYENSVWNSTHSLAALKEEQE